MRPRRRPVTETEARAHHPGLAHQFQDLEQQQETDTLGIWIFLVTEIMFFGGLFAAYAIYRWLYFAAFEGGSHILDIKLGAANTMVLLASSLTMALSVRSAQTGNRRSTVMFLVATMILGSIFLVIKGVEYNQKFEEHVVPTLDWAPKGETLAKIAPGGVGHAEMYFIFYFAMTGLHAIHMIIGMGLLLWLVLRARKGTFTGGYFGPVEVVGLYWHFVDIVWIFLFPLLYLIGGRY
jgi:cytochrome c oxidase subunit 3